MPGVGFNFQPPPRFGSRKINQTHSRDPCVLMRIWPPGADVIKSVKMWSFKDVASERTIDGFFLGRMCGLNDFLFDFFLTSWICEQQLWAPKAWGGEELQPRPDPLGGIQGGKKEGSGKPRRRLGVHFRKGVPVSGETAGQVLPCWGSRHVARYVQEAGKCFPSAMRYT